MGVVVAIESMHAKAAKDEVQAERFAREAKQTVRSSASASYAFPVPDAGP
jgi:hypothetical protein